MADFALAVSLCLIHVSIDQEGAMSAAQLQIVMGEMREIWRVAGVDVTSGRYGEPVAAGDATISLRILRVLPPERSRGDRVLAWVTVEEDGSLAPRLFVSLPSVTATLFGSEFAGVPFKRLTGELRERLVARAVGRVAAHELGHYLLQRAGHQNRGLMRRSYSPRDLVGDWRGPFTVAFDQQPVVRNQIAALARAQGQD